MLIILVMLITISFSVALVIMRNRAEADYRTRMAENAVNNAVSTINASYLNYNYLTRLLMINTRVVNFLKKDRLDADTIYEARHGIYEIQNLYSYIDSVYIFRNDGRFVGTGRADYAIDMSNPELQHILDQKGSTVVSINGNGMIKKNTNEQLLTLARAVYDINSQQLLGVLIMNVSSKYYEDALKIQEEDGLCILDDKGNILCGQEEIAQLYDAKVDGCDFFCKPVTIEKEKKMLAGTQAIEPIIVLCTSGGRWKLQSLETFGPLMIPLAAFVISAFICVGFITGNITKPIMMLGEEMEQNKLGDGLKKLEIEMPGTELSNLVDSYNAMIEYLNQLLNQLLENEKYVRTAEMRALQEQVKPHFLYNTLESISYMALQENARKVHDSLETLGNFYRNFLNNGNREIPLKKEIRITQDYLALQKLRYGDVISDEYDVDEKYMEYMIPKLILQPLVENSIYHGIRLKGERGIIRISAKEDDDGLHIIVYDTGIGMTKEKIDEILFECSESNHEMQGFGLSGTINRIRIACDTNHVATIKSELGEYTEIDLCIPVKRPEEE